MPAPALQSRDVIIPHDPTRGRVTAVRRMLVHSSLIELKEIGAYDRYRSFIDADALQQITESLGPGWLPIELAQAHYRACDSLQLPDTQIVALGLRAGEKLQDSLLVTTVKGGPGAPSVWEGMGAFWRMGRRLWEGGSSQYVRLGPTEMQIETRGNPLFDLRYYRTGHGGFLRGAMSSLGVTVTNVKLTLEGEQAFARVTWR